MLSHLALILLLSSTEGFERSVSSRHRAPVRPSTPRPPAELDSNSLFVTDTDLKKRIEEGSKAIEAFQDSPCWSEVKANFNAIQCNIPSAKKERLTLVLVNCHLEKTGHPPIECPADVPVADCLKQLKDNDLHFNAYTQFQFHFENVCISVKREVFQEDTQRIVNNLYVASQETATNLQSFARSAEDARAHMTHLLQEQQNEFTTNLDAFHQNHLEKFESLSKAAELLDAKQDGMVNALQQKSEGLHSVLEKSLAIQQDVQANQTSLLAQFSRANQTLARLEDQQEAALALVHTTTSNLEQLSRTQRSAFSETNKSLSSLSQKQSAIDSSIQKSLEASAQLNTEQAKLFDLLSEQEVRHQSFLQILSATKEDLNDLSLKQRSSFEDSAQQVNQIVNMSTSFAQSIHSQLDESKKVQELALRSVSGGFAAISSSQEEIQQKQQQLLSSVAGAHGKLEELQKRNIDSFEAATNHLESIREESQKAEERVRKVMAGLESRLEAGLQRILALDHSILGELFTIKAVVFYTSCTVAIFLCTTSKHTQRIRIHLFVGMAINYYLEAQAFYFTEWFSFSDSLILIALLRKMFMGFVCASLALAAWRFRDFHELNYEAALHNQSMLYAIMQHLRRRAIVEQFDTSDLDVALAQAPRNLLRPFKDDLARKVPASAFNAVSPLKRTVEPEPKHLLLSSDSTDDEETETDDDEKKPSVDDDSVDEDEDCNSMGGVEQVIEEPGETPVLGLSPRCRVACKSGLPCKNSARRCGVHRSRDPNLSAF